MFSGENCVFSIGQCVSFWQTCSSVFVYWAEIKGKNWYWGWHSRMRRQIKCFRKSRSEVTLFNRFPPFCCTCAANSHWISDVEKACVLHGQRVSSEHQSQKFKPERSIICHFQQEGLKQTSCIKSEQMWKSMRQDLCEPEETTIIVLGGKKKPKKTCVACPFQHVGGKYFYAAERKKTAHFARSGATPQHNAPTRFSGKKTRGEKKKLNKSCKG